MAPAGTYHSSIIDETQLTLRTTPVSGVEKTPEVGLGDEAYGSKAQGMFHVFSVRQGSSDIRVRSLTNQDAFVKANTPVLDEHDRTVDRKLALEIAKRL